MGTTVASNQTTLEVHNKIVISKQLKVLIIGFKFPTIRRQD